MIWLDNTTNSMYMNLTKLQETGEEREAWCATVLGVAKSRYDLVAEQHRTLNALQSLGKVFVLCLISPLSPITHKMDKEKVQVL